MNNRHFDDEKIQEIYNAEYAKEIAKIDAAKEKANNKSSVAWIIYICILGGLLIFLWKSFF